MPYLLPADVLSADDMDYYRRAAGLVQVATTNSTTNNNETENS